MCPAVAVVGTGPAAEAIVATLAEYDDSDDASDQPRVTVERPASPAFDDVALGVVVGRVGDEVFTNANHAARDSGTPWIAVELGGIGGYPVTTAAVSGFDPDGACYDCLAGRVEANVDPETEPTGALDPATQRVVGSIAGEAAIDVVDDDSDAEVLGRVTELPYTERRLLTLPGCSCGPVRDLRVRRGFDDVPVKEALARAEQGLDDRIGIAQRVGEAESFPAPYYLAQLCDTSGFSDVTAPRQAAGVAVDWDAAFMKALGESYERYAAGVYTEEDTLTATANQLDSTVAPSAFVTPEEPSWDTATSIEWAPATNLATEEPTHVPAELVFHPPRDGTIRPPLTTGLGLGSSPVGALLSGLYEVVERDASMLAWYSSYDPLGLSVDDELFETLAARAGSEGLTVTSLLLTQDVDVPVVAVAVHREEWPKFAIGSAAHLDPHLAARGALEEAVQNWMELRSMGPDDAADAGGAIGKYAESVGAGRELIDVDQTVPAASVGPDDVPPGEAQLDALVERVTDVGASVYATRTTTPDLASIGLEAVRVLVPSAQPLFLGDPFFGERAQTVPRDLGFEPRSRGPPSPSRRPPRNCTVVRSAPPAMASASLPGCRPPRPTPTGRSHPDRPTSTGHAPTATTACRPGQRGPPDGIFRLVDPPAGQAEMVADTLAAIDYPWWRLAPAVARDPDGAVLIIWDDLGQRGTGLFYGHTIEIHLSTRYAGWQAKVPFILAHEIGHLVDAATLRRDDRGDLAALVHGSPETYRRDDEYRNGELVLHAHAQDHNELWTRRDKHYFLMLNEAYADLFVAAFAPAIWAGRDRPPRFTHWTSDLQAIRDTAPRRRPRPLVRTLDREGHRHRCHEGPRRRPLRPRPPGRP